MSHLISYSQQPYQLRSSEQGLGNCRELCLSLQSSSGAEYGFKFQSPSSFLLTGEPAFHRIPAKVTPGNCTILGLFKRKSPPVSSPNRACPNCTFIHVDSSPWNALSSYSLPLQGFLLQGSTYIYNNG